MTDTDIMKTFEAIASESIGDCKRDCAFYDGRVHYCAGVISRNALDLIRRYNAEIADLQDGIRCEKETNKHLCDEYIALLRECDRIKAEIERLKVESANIVARTLKKFEKEIKGVGFTLGQTWEIQCALKNVLKEMTEEKKNV